MMDKWRCFPVALCVLSLGCGGKKSEAPEKGGAGAVEKTAGVAEAPKGAFLAKFRLGSSSTPDGLVIAETRNFQPGEAVFVSFEMSNAPAGSNLRVGWSLLPDKKPVSRQEVPISPGNSAVAFKGDSTGWPIGEYELEMSLAEPGKENPRSMGTAQFRIVKDKPK